MPKKKYHIPQIPPWEDMCIIHIWSPPCLDHSCNYFCIYAEQQATVSLGFSFVFLRIEPKLSPFPSMHFPGVCTLLFNRTNKKIGNKFTGDASIDSVPVEGLAPTKETSRKMSTSGKEEESVSLTG